MNSKWIKLSSVALLSLYLAACDAAEEETADEESVEVVDDSSEEDDHGHDDEDHDHEHDDEDHDHEHDDEDHDHEHDDEDHDHEHDDEDHDHAHGDADVQETVEIEGVSHHYHTGALVEWTAVIADDNGYDDWHWYMRADDSAEWEIISGQHSEELVFEAPEESMEIKAVLYDDAHDAFAQSAAVELEVDNH